MSIKNKIKYIFNFGKGGIMKQVYGFNVGC